MNTNRLKLRHIINKIAKVEDKEIILKVAKKKKAASYLLGKF